MRSIVKGVEPHQLRKWKRDNRATPHNLFYGGGDFPAESLRKALLAEQFHLCAYTMKLLKTAKACEEQGGNTTDSCHIEHVLPQANHPARAIDYKNMVACFPPSRSTTACAFGAIAKKKYDPAAELFVSPLQVNAERHFKFHEDGMVDGLTPEGEATVEVLNLNHATLINDRAAVIKGSLEPRRGKPLSAAEARRLAAHVNQPDADAKLTAYCVAIAQVALRHAEKEERRAARLRNKP
jgi:hypothetical protein